MKIIQSFWSCGQPDLLNFNSGWFAPEYHLMSLTLSCLQLKKYYQNLTLYADTVGSQMLIDTLKLPYTEVVCELDTLNQYPRQLFALPKIYAYSSQTTPFLHIDSDVFIWKAFDQNLLSGSLIAQNKEAGTQYYEMIMQSLEAGLTFFPSEIIAERKKNSAIYAYNAGIMGGNDICFFNLYTQKAKEFVNKNIKNLSKIPVFNFNIFFEQYLFYCLAKKLKKKVQVLQTDTIDDLRYEGFGDFIEVPHNKQYLHLIGIYKGNKKVCDQLAGRLRQDYPEYYYRIISLFKDKQVPLKRDYYYYLDQSSEKYLTDRYFRLKSNNSNIEQTTNQERKNTKSEPQPHLVRFVKKTISIYERKQSTCNKKLNFNNHIKDLNSFENKLITILQKKLSAYSKEYLYARDILCTQYFQLLFENKQSYLDKTIIADTINEKINSKFNWAGLERDFNTVFKILMTEPAHFCTMVVPECDIQGYSLVNIDELDILLLSISQKPSTIAELLISVRPAFNPLDIENQANEFEMLIIARIKMLLETKLLKLNIFSDSKKSMSGNLS